MLGNAGTFGTGTPSSSTGGGGEWIADGLRYEIAGSLSPVGEARLRLMGGGAASSPSDSEFSAGGGVPGCLLDLLQ